MLSIGPCHTTLRFLVLVILLIVTFLSLSASARDIDGDWTIDIDTTVSDETIAVRGNVIVNASLRMDRCSLVLVRANDGLFITITENGRMVADGCIIKGDPGRVYFNSSGDLNLTHCVVSHLYDNYPHGGMNLYGGQAVIRHSTITDVRSKSIYSETDLVLENVTFRGSQHSFIYLSDAGATSSLSLEVRDCDLDGTDNGAPNKPDGVFVQANDDSVNTTVLISGCVIRTCDPGIFLRTYGNMTATVKDCIIQNCTDGVGSEQRGPSNISLTGLWISQGWGQQPCGFRPYLGPQTVYSVKDVAVDDYLFGCWLQMIEDGDLTVPLVNVTISDCYYGIKGWKSGGGTGILRVNVTNSSVSSDYEEFIAWTNIRITIWDTVHTPGSADVGGSYSWVRGYTNVHPLGARWHNGPDITSGLVSLYDGQDALVTIVDLADIVPVSLLGWEKSNNDGFTIRSLLPRISLDERTWDGVGYDPWRSDRGMLVFIDDVAPTVHILQPTNSEVFEITSVMVRGTCVERGSGLMVVEYSLDDAEYRPATSFGGGSWEISLNDLQEGGHSLMVRGVDMVNRSGGLATVGFFINHLPPHLDVDTLPDATSQPLLLLTGTAEPETWVTVNDLPAAVRSDGSFDIRLTLEEGVNVLAVKARDQWDKVSWVNMTIVLDSTPPSISDLAPVNGSWLDDDRFTLEGRTDVDAVVSLDGAPIDLVDGSFREYLDVEEGDVSVTLRAEDPLGNALVLVLVYHVDLTVPVLTITSPDQLSFITTLTPLEMSGDVDDPSIDHLTINDVAVYLTSGVFQYSLDLTEGNNTITVTVLDNAANEHTTMLFVTLDTTNPTYELDMECEGGELLEVDGDLFATSDELIIDFRASEEVFVTLADGSEEGPLETTHLIMHLTEGKNRVYLRVNDLAGNQGMVYEAFVVLDTTPPTISVDKPLADLKTTKGSVLISGMVEPGSRLLVNGENITILGDGSFEVEWGLDMGENTITLEAEDLAGHTNSTTLMVTREEEGGIAGSGAIGALCVLAVAAIALSTRRRRRS